METTRPRAGAGVGWHAVRVGSGTHLRDLSAGVEILLCVRRAQETGLIFCTVNGTMMEQGRVHDFWTRACEKAGIPRYRIHDLRHSVASNLIAGGMGLLEVAHLLGHQNATMVTQVYGHLAPDDHKRAAALMDALLERQRAAIP